MHLRRSAAATTAGSVSYVTNREGNLMATVSAAHVTMRADEVMVITDADHHRPSDTGMALDKAAAEKLIGELSAGVHWPNGQQADRMTSMRDALDRM